MGATGAAAGPIASAAAVAAPTPDAAPQATGRITPLDAMLATLPESVNPVSALIAPMQDMLSSVAITSPEATAFIEPMQETLELFAEIASAVVGPVPVRSSVSTLFGLGAEGSGVAGLGGYSGAGVSATNNVYLPMTPTSQSGGPVPAVTPVADPPRLPLAVDPAEVVKFGGIAPAPTRAGPAPAVPEKADLAAGAAIPMGVQSFVKQAFRELVRSPSLAALAAIALPGVGGLLILTAAGMRIGYRQAKAGLALRSAGIARFAPGPLGVVRSGSFIAVRPRPKGSVRSRASAEQTNRRLRAVRFLDEAA